MIENFAAIGDGKINLTMEYVDEIEVSDSEPHTPVSHEQDEEEVNDDEGQDVESPQPRKLVRQNAVAGKEPRKRAEPCSPPSSEEEGFAQAEDVPDLRAYFALFVDFPELEQVKMCRSYATYLSSMNPKNRLRYSAKSATSWKKRK